MVVDSSPTKPETADPHNSKRLRKPDLPRSKTLGSIKGMMVWWRSVQGRLTLLNLGLLTLLFIGLALAQYLLLGNYLADQLDASLRAEAKPTILRQLSGRIGQGGQINMIGPRLAYDLTSKQTVSIIIGADGKVFRPIGDLIPPMLPPSTGASTLPAPTATTPISVSKESTVAISRYDIGTGITTTLKLPLPPTDTFNKALTGDNDLNYTAQIAGWGKALLVIIPLWQNKATTPGQFMHGDKVLGMVVLAGLTNSNEKALTALVFINLAVFLVLLIIVCAVSPLVAHNSLRPLRRMIKTTRYIAKGDFSRRVHFETGQDEVGQLAISFNEMVQQLEDLFKAQRQLVADASHELRTPLTAIKGSLEVLMLSGANSDPEASNQLVKTTYQEVTRMTRLVNDLLTLNKADRGENLPLQKVKLAPLIYEVKASSEMLIRQSAKPVNLELVGFEAATSVQVVASADHLRQVLYNLIDNALKFSPSNGTIRLELLPAAPLPAELVLSRKINRNGYAPANEGLFSRQKYYGLAVRDQGEGIKPEDLPHIFDRFYRGDASRSRQRGGSGLGLAIVQSLVEAQQGFIQAESTLGKGTTFYLYLQAASLDKSATESK